MQAPAAVPGVVDVQELLGAEASLEAPPDLLVEVPHGADRRAHYDALATQLQGDYPAELHKFFHVNTDVGAWDLGRRVAERVVAARPRTRAWLLRCLIPRTFVDCNRVAGAGPTGDLSGTGITGAMAPYVRDPRDQARLAELHAAYVAVAEHGYATVCGGSGLALNPHTYGPRTLAVDKVDDDIVANLERAHEPGIYQASPMRPPADLITRDEQGTVYGPEGSETALVDALRGLGLDAAVSQTYYLHPVTQGYRFSKAYPGRVLGFEIRRDLLVQTWDPFVEQAVDPGKVDRIAGPFADYVGSWLDRSTSRGRPRRL